jgi:hypothetical protein
MTLFSDLLPGNDSFAAIRFNGNYLTDKCQDSNSNSLLTNNLAIRLYIARDTDGVIK